MRLGRSMEQIVTSARKALEVLSSKPAMSKDALRNNIRTLVTLQGDLRELSLHHTSALLAEKAAGPRLLAYLRLFAGTPVEGAELEVVGGIAEEVRRIRELRVEKGWPIRCLDSTYLLERDAPERDRAKRWQSLNAIRRSGKAARAKMLAVFLAFPGQVVTTDDLRYVAGGRDLRRVRELRTQGGWRIMTRQTGRPDLASGEYVLIDTKPAEEHDRRVSDEVLAEVIERDQGRCRKLGCGWHPSERVQGSPKQYIEVHHIRWHAKGGRNLAANLATLCNVHHRVVHRQKIDHLSFGDWLRTR